MKETLKQTLDFLKQISSTNDIKVSRGYSDFLADRIAQATTETSLLKAAERLATLLNSNVQYINHESITNFIKTASSPKSASVMAWLQEYPKVAAMILTLKGEQYKETIDSLEVKEVSIDKGVALPQGAFDIQIGIKLLSPLAHGADQKAGNATLFRRMQVLTDKNEIISLPFYAGNAFRGQMRDILAKDFVKFLGDNTLEMWFFHALFAGGALEESGGQAKAAGKKMGAVGACKAEGIHQFRDLIPSLSLLGVALGNRIISGRIHVADFRPRCKEWSNGDIDCSQLFEWSFLTRREDNEGHEDGDNKSMIANTECLKAGVELVGGIDLQGHITSLEKSCLHKGLTLMQQVGYIGAENRRGFGKCLYDMDCKEYREYDDYMQSNKDKIVEYLKEIKAIASGQLTI